MAKDRNKLQMIMDKITYSYIRRIKRWMFCPACNKGKMSINKKSTLWTCEECGYKLLADEFEDGYVFWFCDECKTYLNNQKGFDKNSAKHICEKCGYENDTTFDNVKGICSDCGKVIPESDSTLCVDCKIERKKKALLGLVGVVTAVAGAVITAANENETIEYSGEPQDETNDCGNKCANCGNTDNSTLWDEDDTIYCSKCCHRTAKSTGEDDLVECPFCHRMRDRKAYYCRYCNDSTWELSTPEEFEETDKILKEMGL